MNENETGLKDQGTLIAPNAKAKIIIPYKNALTTTDAKKEAVCKEGDICFIGIRDMPVNFYRMNGYAGIGHYFDEDGIPHLKKSQ